MLELTPGTLSVLKNLMQHDCPNDYKSDGNCDACSDVTLLTSAIEQATEKARDKTFVLHWLSGTTHEVRGQTIEQAMTRAGYGAGAVRVLDYYREVSDDS